MEEGQPRLTLKLKKFKTNLKFYKVFSKYIFKKESVYARAIRPKLIFKFENLVPSNPKIRVGPGLSSG